MSETKPKILIVYYTYTQQNSRVTEAMAKAFDERGCEVTQAAIEFTDKRYVDRFSRFPCATASSTSSGCSPPRRAERPARSGSHKKRARATTT